MKDRILQPHISWRTGLFCLLAALLFANSLRAAEDDPAAELSSFTIAPGFEASVFASEKNGVVKPIQIRFDPLGRIWVIGSTVYPQLEPGQTPNDKVLVLEDTDGDGKCDKTTVFADGLMIPTGIELGDGGVYIGHGTELLFLKDTDGDLRADERRALLRGFGTGDNHQNINSFLWGPGGELWFCQGLHTHSNVETPWGIVRMNMAGLWRFRPRLKRLESFYGSTAEPQNPWGYVFTDWGEPLVIAGNNSSMIYPVPGLTARHFDLAPPLIWKNGGGRKSSGADIVGTTHFPPDWQGLIITGGYINNAVWALEIREDGAGFALVDREPLIKSSSRNFRPVDVKFGPDGALYICDWYNPIIGHYQASFRHPDRDKTHGRIWRVTAKGRPLTAPPRLADASTDQLFEYLTSADRWTRQFAKRVLADRDAQEVAAAVEKWLARIEPSEHALKEALGVLQSHELFSEPLLRRLAHAKAPGARAYAASAIGRSSDRLTGAVEWLRPLASDENPRVRLHAIVASSYIPQWQALEIAAAAAARPVDKFIEYALKQTVFALKEHWFTASREGRLDPSQTPEIISLFLQAGQAAEIASEAQGFLRSEADLAKRLAVGRALLAGGDAAQLLPIIQLKDETLRAQLMPEVVKTVRQRRLGPPHGVASVLQSYISTNDPGALTLAGIWKLKPFQEKLASVAGAKNLPEPVRIAAMEGIAAWQKTSDKLRAIARDAAGESAGVRAAAVAALARIDPEQSAQLASELQFSERPAWERIFQALLQRQGGPAALAKAFAGRQVPETAAEVGLRLMNESGRRDEALAQVLNPAPATGLSFSDIPALTARVRSRGNAARGELIYRRAELGCVTCHSIRGEGGTIGPDLGALGTAQPVDFIIGAILDPQKEVKEGYMASSISTRDGDEYQGYLVRETAGELVLRDTLLNAVVSIPKSRIQARRQSGSLMPAGLTAMLGRDEFIDLVKYLSELGQ